MPVELVCNLLSNEIIMLYLINKNIVFNTEDRTLAMQQDDLSVVTLSNSSNRLLYELLYSYGQTVSRDTLFQNVWDNHGLVSSNSNLNHYISQLRKSLVSFGLSEKVIITVPKTGFKFSDEVQVMLLDNDGQTPRAEQIIKESSESIDNQLDKLAATILSETQDRDVLVKNEEPKPESNLAALPDLNKTLNSGHSRKLLYMVSLAVLLTSAVLVGLFFAMGNNKDKLNNTFLSVSNTCPIYTFYPLSMDIKEKMVEEVESIVKDRNISCGNNQFIMVHYVNKTLTSLCSAQEERSFSCSVINS